MIKKNTKMIFEGEGSQKELLGGIPLIKGEIIKVKENGQKYEYEVTEKNVEVDMDGDDQIANITYNLRKL